VAGYSFGSVTSDDYATVKYNASGIQQWVARYNGPDNFNDQVIALAVDAAGNVYVTGYSGVASKFADYTTIKYNASGVEQWVARYDNGPQSYDQATAISVDATGNVYVTGFSYSSSIFSSDYVTIKYDGAGVQQWLTRYNGLGNSYDQATALAVDAAGNVYVTGFSAGSSTVDDYATIKYNAAGVQQWVTRYNGPGNSIDNATALALDAAGNVYVTGYSHGSSTPADYATVKFSAPE